MIFVTGGTGFLGSHLLHKLVSMGRQVRAFYRDEESRDRIRVVGTYYPQGDTDFVDKIEWIQGDILDFYTLSESLSGITDVYHAAGIVSFVRNEREKLLDTNIRGTANVVNACLEQKINKLCYVSSIAALGESENGEPIDETRLWNENTAASPYSRSKFRGEMEVWRGIHEGLKAVIINPSVIIGPGMWLGRSGDVFSGLARGLNYYPAGAAGYVDIRDVIRIMVSLMERPIVGERFIVSAENLSHQQLLTYLAEALHTRIPGRVFNPLLGEVICLIEQLRTLVTGKPPRITRDYLKIMSARSAYSNQKIRETLSYDFIPIRDTVFYTARHFLSSDK